MPETVAILQQSLELMSAYDVGILLQEVMNVPLADATRLARHAFGILDENVSVEDGRRIKERLAVMGIDVFLVPMSELRSCPSSERVRNADCLEESWNVELPSGEFERVPWESVHLITCGKLSFDETKYITAKGPGLLATPMPMGFGGMGYGGHVHRHPKRKRKTKSVEKFLVRVLCDNPLRSYQIDHEEFNFDYLGNRLAMDSLTNIVTFLQDMAHYGPNVMVCQNTTALLEDDKKSITKFPGMPDFDEYNVWLLHLVSQGGEV